MTHSSELQRRTRRSSEREPADSLTDQFNIIGGWLPSLTFALCRERPARLMAHLHKNMRRLLLFLLIVGGTHWARSQSTIAYTGGPAFGIPSEFTPASIDLNQDGIADFSFIGGFPLCTMDVPCSLCTWSFYVTAVATNAMQTQGYYASILPAGEWIGPATPANSVWSIGGNATLLTWWWSERFGTSGASGPLGESGEGYLGTYFYAADGLHYAWIHVRYAAVLDWAYETRPGAPIRAGAKPVTVPVAPPAVVRPGYLRLQWSSEIGKAYQIQARGRLDAFPWTTLSWVIPATATNSMVDLPMSEPIQFLRVVEAD